MFAPKAAKTRTKASASETNRLAQQTWALRSHRAASLGENDFRQHGEQEADSESLTTQGSTSRFSWDFAKISVFPPDGASRPRSSSPLAATPLPGFIQPKLAIGAVDDPLEREADRVADQVMRMPDGDSPELSCKGAAYGSSMLHNEPAGSRTPRMEASEAPAIVNETLCSPGLPLEAAVRAQMEAGLGHDFGRVRVHVDEKAAASASAINALAYTVGSDIVFGAGHYAPATAAGMKLLAHEMAHVVQQEASGLDRAAPAPATIQRQRAPKQQPLGPDAARIAASAGDTKRDLKARAVKLVYDILNTYFSGYSSKVAGVGYDDKKAAKERLSTEPKKTNDPAKTYGIIWVGHVLVEEAISDPGGFAGVVASIAHELEHVDQWRDPTIGPAPATKNQREFLAHAHEALFVEPAGTSRVHHSARATHIDAALGAYNCLDGTLQQKPDYLALRESLLARRAHEIKYTQDPTKLPPATCIPAP